MVLRKRSGNPEECAASAASVDRALIDNDRRQMMVVQIVQFELAGIAPEEYEAHTEQVAPKFARLPGLIAKAWLGDREENTYGGVYLWADRAAAEAYEEGDVLAAVRGNPAFVGFRSSIFDTLAAPTALTTRGLAELATEVPA